MVHSLPTWSSMPCLRFALAGFGYIPVVWRSRSLFLPFLQEMGRRLACCPSTYLSRVLP